MIYRLQRLAEGRPLTIAMESTGTYGDASSGSDRCKVDGASVSGKAVHDYAEIFDGVPSQHDGKDAAMVAELAAIGKSSPWPYEPLTEFDQELRYLVERMDVQQRIGMLWLGRLEALLAGTGPRRHGTGVEFRNLVSGLTRVRRPGGVGGRRQGGEATQRLGRSAP